MSQVAINKALCEVIGVLSFCDDLAYEVRTNT